MPGNIIFFTLLLISTSRIESLKEPDVSIDKSFGSENSKESLSIYIDKDNILSVNELRRLYNVEESFIPDIQAVKEIDKTKLKKLRLRKNRPKLGTEREESTKENRYSEQGEAKTGDIKNVQEHSTESESRNSHTDVNKEASLETSTVITERGATTVSPTTYKTEEKSAESEEYENDFDDYEYSATTEQYKSMPVSKQELRSDDAMALSLTTDTVFESADYPQERSVKDILAGYQDLVPETEKIINVGDHARTHEQDEHLYPFRKRISLDSKGKSNNSRSSEPEEEEEKEEEELDKQSENEEVKVEELLEKEEEIKNEDELEDFTSNAPGNEYPYVPLHRNTQLLRNQPPNIFSKPKLTQASDQALYPAYNRFPSGNNFNYGRFPPYYSLYNTQIQPLRPYNFRRSGRICNGC